MQNYFSSIILKQALIKGCVYQFFHHFYMNEYRIISLTSVPQIQKQPSEAPQRGIPLKMW